MTNGHVIPGRRLLVIAGVALALGALLALAFATGRPAAAGPIEEIVDLNLPIKVEETRDVPKRVVRDVQGQGASITQQATPTPTTLVGNTGQANASPATFGSANDRTVPFTTGTNSLGYKLTSVDFQFGVAGAASHFTVKIRKEHTAGSADRPADGSNNLVGTLSRTAALTVGNNSFTAAGAGLDLDANTTYFLILDSVSSPTPEASATTSSNWDSGEAAGWSIVNKMVFRSASSAAWMGNSQLDTSGRKLKFAVNGYSKTPVLVSAEITGAKLTLNFDNNLDTTSGTAASAFTVKIDGTSHTPSAISISARQVTLTVPEATHDQTVTVSYVKPGTNPLKSSDGVDLTDITDQAVEHTVIDRLSQPPRAPITVTYDGQQFEAKAFSAERGTLYDYFEAECTGLQSVASDRDYSFFMEFDTPSGPREFRVMARNGWKWVAVQNANGDITGTRPMSIRECASNKLYQRQAFCEQYADRQGPNEQKVCPTYRTW